MDADLEQRIAALEDRWAIEELRSRYGWYAARGDADGVASLFTVDCLFEGPDGPGRRVTVRTRARLAAYLSQAISKPGSAIPFLYNHIVAVQGDRAEGSCAIKPHIRVGEMEMLGYYVEKLVRKDEGWLFDDRRLYLYQPYLELG
jgi:hypothetical protein